MHDSSTLQKRFIAILFLALAVTAQHNHGHSHHGEPKSEWDEEEYLRGNPPTPPSYWSEDTKMRMSPEEELPVRYPWLMVLHILFMSGAFFVALPAGECFSHFVLPFHGSHNPRRKPRGGSPFPTPTYSPVPVTLSVPRSLDQGRLLILISRLVISPGIALRSVKSSFHALSVVAFYGFVALGLSSSALYKKLTPDL